MPPDFSHPSLLDEARRFNRMLAWAPRLKMRTRFTPGIVQTLLRLSQTGGARRLAQRGVRAEDRVVGTAGVAVRILRPARQVRAVVLDIHGGAWVIGNAQMNDRLNADMIAACDIAVVSVDYRLARDTGLHDSMGDCLAAAVWLLEGGLPEYAGLPVFVVGESAGGHLAAATLEQLKARPDLLCKVQGAVLYYGLYDMTGTPSVRGAGPDTLLFDGPGMVAALKRLTPGLGDAERRQPPLSPLYGDLAGMPPALMFAGALDPLRDDTTEMATRWREVAEAEVHLVPEAPHGFIRFPTRQATAVRAHTHRWLLARIDGGGAGV